ncbi:MAG: hypothetical protein GY853_10340 [PVC group bacterium]|nr:hypothetical protein [PVC group bacterium]
MMDPQKWQVRDKKAREKGKRLCGSKTKDDSPCGVEINNRWWWPWCKEHVPILTKTLGIIGVAGFLAILGFSDDLIGLYSFFLAEPTATKSDIDSFESRVITKLEIIENQNFRQNGIDGLDNSNLDNMKAILQDNYPLGFAILFLDGERIYIDDDSLHRCLINWKQTEIELIDDYISFSHIHVECEKILVRLHGVPFKVSDVGNKYKFTHLREIQPYLDYDIGIWVENIGTVLNRSAFAIGLKENSLEDKETDTNMIKFQQVIYEYN